MEMQQELAGSEGPGPKDRCFAASRFAIGTTRCISDLRLRQHALKDGRTITKTSGVSLCRSSSVSHCCVNAILDKLFQSFLLVTTAVCCFLSRSAVTLGPLFDAYLLNIGGVCLSCNQGLGDGDAALFALGSLALFLVPVRNGNKLVGAVESTSLVCIGAGRHHASELELPRRGILQLVLAYPIGAV